MMIYRCWMDIASYLYLVSLYTTTYFVSIFVFSVLLVGVGDMLLGEESYAQQLLNAISETTVLPTFVRSSHPQLA